MLKAISLKDFKSFKDEKIALSDLTILVGANASGKSNLLDAIRFLQGIALDFSLADVFRGRWEGGRKAWPGVRGGQAEVVRKGARELIIESEWVLRGEKITHMIGCVAGEYPAVQRERLATDRVSGYLFDTHADALRDTKGIGEGESIRVAVKRQGKGNSLTQAGSTTRSLFFQIKSPSSVSKDVAIVRDRVTDAMRATYFLDINPARMRDYVPKGIDYMGLEGENVSALTWKMCQEPESKADLVDWLTELCAPELVDIDFSTTDIGDVMLILVEKGERRIPARSLSDGTLRFLGELIALRTAPEGSILLMEEIENGLHPTRAHLLVEAMEAAVNMRGIQIIATTHSPLVLNAFSQKALHNAILVAHPPDWDGSRLCRLGDLPDFDAVRERRGIDRLLASGWLERAL